MLLTEVDLEVTAHHRTRVLLRVEVLVHVSQDLVSLPYH